MRNSGFAKFFRIFISFAIIITFVTSDVWFPDAQKDIIHRISRNYEFDYIGWELSALWDKAVSLSFGLAHHLNNHEQRKIIEDYFRLLSDIRQVEQQITELYGQPEGNPSRDIPTLEGKLRQLNKRLRYQTNIAEAVMQYQISHAISTLEIPQVGTPFPPVLFHTTSLPMQLIISPRNTIHQEMSVSLRVDISLNEIVELEEAIEAKTEYSALVVPIGGISTYPTMIIQSTHFPNLIDTAAHEWIHNHLIFRPLGIQYSASSALRTMNETTANISGTEIMEEVIHLYFPEYLQTEDITPETVNAVARISADDNSQPFIFAQEMYETRNHVDELLAAGNIEQAEKYMEARRQFFWENGYHIRKLNQAYFAFYGAYADSPFSAAGSDPVGEDVRLFRSQQPDLKSFLWKMSWMYNYRQLRFAARSF